MQRDKPKIDLCSIERNTGFVKQYVQSMINRAMAMKGDNERLKRLEQMECVYCYGGYEAGRMGGAACTSCECGLCNNIIYSGNTNIDILCLACAKREKLCKHCGADIDLKRRRNRKQPVVSSFHDLVDLVKESEE